MSNAPMFSPQWIVEQYRAARRAEPDDVGETQLTIKLSADVVQQMREYSEYYRVPMKNMLEVGVRLFLTSDPDPERISPRRW